MSKVKHKKPYKEFLVKEDGIHLINHELFHKNFEMVCKDSIVIPKETFIEAFEKWIYPHLECVDMSAVRTQPVITFVKERE